MHENVKNDIQLVKELIMTRKLRQIFLKNESLNIPTIVMSIKDFHYALHVLFLILYIKLHENISLPPCCKMILWDFFVIFHDEIKYINTNEAKRLIINITLVIKKNDIKY